MLFILEGEDGVGKTTIVRELMKLYPEWNYIHNNAPVDEDDLSYKAMETMSFARDSSITIMDRCVLVDGLVYDTPIIRNDPKKLRYVEEIIDLYREDIFVFLVHAPYNTIRDRFIKYRPNETIPTRVEHLQKDRAYLDYLVTHDIDRYEILDGSKNPKDNARKIIATINTELMEQWLKEHDKEESKDGTQDSAHSTH